MKVKHILTSLALVLAIFANAADAPKYIFYYIGDGMGLGPVMAAESYNRYVLNGTTPLLMNTFPTVGWSTTYSASSPVTDSAAAGTALATGYKTGNGMLGVLADSTRVNSIAHELFIQGWGVGLVTSVSPDDATPGAFYAHVPSRSMYHDIDSTMAQCGYQFIGGAGFKNSQNDGRADAILSHINSAGVQVLRGPEQINDMNSERVLLLNSEGTAPENIGYTVDSIQGVLTLPQLASACLAQLERTSPNRFFMMVEGGNIDHALHGNDGGAAVMEIIKFNEALRVAYDFYMAHPNETLIVVTADHDTGGLTLNSHNEHTLSYLSCQRISKAEFSEMCKAMLNSRRNYEWSDIKEILNEQLGLFGTVPVSAEDEQSLREIFEQTFAMRNSIDQETLYASFNSFAVEAFKLFNEAVGLRFTTTGHSGNPVPVYAIGCGADNFTGYIDNINIPTRIRSILSE